MIVDSLCIERNPIHNRNQIHNRNPIHNRNLINCYKHDCLQFVLLKEFQYTIEI
jgi:hypothetical protein